MLGPAPKTRVLLADDHCLVAAGIQSMLEPFFEVVGTAANGRALVEAAERLKPDVILLDISMPELNGLEAARQLRKLVPGARLIFVTMHMDATLVREALRIGGAGYVSKQSAPKELMTAIEEVLHGRVYVTPLVAKELVKELAEGALTGEASSTPSGRLTTRQREVLQLVAEGHSNKEIAAKLGVSPRTVEFHRSNIGQSLGLSTTADLVKYAVRHGLVSE